MTGPYNVLHTVRSLRLDGVTKVVLRTIAHRQSAEFTHHVCSMRADDALAGECRATGVEPAFIGYTGAASAARAVAVLARIIRTRRIDVVHANRTLDLALAGTAAAMTGVPVVSTLHWLGRISDHPEDGDPRSVRRRAEMMSPVLLNRVLADRIIAVSGAVRDSFASLPGFPRDRTVVVYPGADVGSAPDPRVRSAARASLGVDPDRPLVLNVGRLQPVKGQVHLIPMMERVRRLVPNALLLVAGEGELRAPLERSIADRGLADAVRLLGARSDVDALLAASDVLVVASESEAAPLPVFEAMRAARPVVATRVGGIPEIVEEGVTGLLASPGDPAAMGEAVITVLTSADRGLAMGTAGRRALIERFDIEHTVRTIEEIYRALISGRGRRAAPTLTSPHTGMPGAGHRPST